MRSTSLSRSIGREKLARRDSDFVAAVERDWTTKHGATVLESPIEVGRHQFSRRLVTRDQLNFDDLPSMVAPDSEAHLSETYQRAERLLENKPALVVVRDGTALTRRLLAERLRLHYGTTVAVVEPDASIDDAATLVLSGRADLVCMGGGAK